MKKIFPGCHDGAPTIPQTLLFHSAKHFVISVTAESTPYVCFCFPGSSEFDEILPVIHFSIRFISSFRLSCFRVLHS